MAVILQFPSTFARVSRDPAERALRDRLQPLADLAERLGPLSAHEAAGLRELALTVAADDPDRINSDELHEYLRADIDGKTWRAWLRAYGRLNC